MVIYRERHLMKLRSLSLASALMLWAVGCDSDSSTTTPTPDMGQADMVIPVDGSLTEDASSSQPSCAPICGFLMSQCSDMGKTCARCERLRENLRPAHENRTWARCETAVGALSCVGVTACLADKHGIVAHGNPIQVAFNTGATVASLPEIDVDDAWAIIGSKSDALPSDLEIYFLSGDAISMLKIDDAATLDSTGIRMAETYTVEFETTGVKVKFAYGELNFEQWSISGENAGFVVSGTIRETQDGVNLAFRLQGDLSED